jgi:ornithine cyclodeaminase
MPVRILSQVEVTALLLMAECTEVMEAVLRTLSQGGAQLPLRTVLRLPQGKGFFGVMPAQLDAPESFGLKAIAVFPGNEGTRLDSHQGLVLLFDPDTGVPTAVLDASSITAIAPRRWRAPGRSRGRMQETWRSRVRGAGAQPSWAMAVVRQLRRSRVGPPAGWRILRWAHDRLGSRVVGSPATPWRADLICTVSAATTPVVLERLGERRAHSTQPARAPDARDWIQTVVRGRLFVDRLESARNEAETPDSRQEGSDYRAHACELGEVLLGCLAGAHPHYDFRRWGSPEDWRRIMCFARPRPRALTVAGPGARSEPHAGADQPFFEPGGCPQPIPRSGLSSLAAGVCRDPAPRLAELPALGLDAL